MVYRRLADLVVVVHALIVWFSLFGAFSCWQYAWIALIHVPLATWGTVASILGWTCPLTSLENHLRKAAVGQGYEGSFVDHYLGQPTIGRKNQIILGVFFGVLSLVLHGANVARYHDAIWPRAAPVGVSPTGVTK